MPLHTHTQARACTTAHRNPVVGVSESVYVAIYRRTGVLGADRHRLSCVWSTEVPA